MNQRLFVLYAGGTIGMRMEMTPDTQTQTLIPQPLAHLQQYIPASIQQQFNLTFASVSNIIDSADAEPDDWLSIARSIAAVYDDYDGFVVLHGTDTLAYMASALSFIFANLTKPVVCTGAQLPIYHPRTDGLQNLINAISVAGYHNTQSYTLQDVVIVFNQSVLRACRSRKMSSYDLQGFASPNHPVLGRCHSQIELYEQYLKPSLAKPLQLYDKLAINQVVDITLYPSMAPDYLYFLVEQTSVKAMILRSYGSGNLPKQLKPVIEKLLASGKIMINISQCWQANVNMLTYQTAVEYANEGVLPGGDMTPEAALVKTMWLLAHYPLSQVKTMVTLNLRGECDGTLRMD